MIPAHHIKTLRALAVYYRDNGFFIEAAALDAAIEVLDVEPEIVDTAWGPVAVGGEGGDA